MIIFIYGLFDPNDGKCRYVGMSKNPQKRFKEHILYKQHNSYKFGWIKGLLQLNKIPLLKILEEVNENNWQKKEQWWIRYFKKKGQNLTNLTEGGEGTFGIKCSEEKKIKISKSLIGHEVSSESRKKMSEKIKKRIETKGPPRLGKRHSEEARKKMSQAHTGYLMPEIQKKKISQSTFNNPLTQKRPDIIFKDIEMMCIKNNFILTKVAKSLECSRSAILSKIKKQGFNNWESFCEYSGTKSKEHKKRKNILFEEIILIKNQNKNISLRKLASLLDCSRDVILIRLRNNGFESWKKFILAV